MRPGTFIRSIAQFIAFGIIVYASYLLLLLSLPYIHFEPYVDFLATKQLIYHIKPWRYSFYIHVFTSPLVIVFGLLQFSPWLYKRARKFHKMSGYIYVVTLLLVTGPAAFIMSLYANGGYVAQVSFVTLSFLWILFTLIALLKVRKHDYLSHVKWNLRSYSLTLSAVTLRFYAYLFDVFNVNIGPVETYIIVAYLSWLPNLIFVELLIRFRYPEYLLQGRD